MIVIGIGANLEHPIYGEPRRTCGAALAMLEKYDIRIDMRSKWYRTAPVLSPNGQGEKGEQPWYINGAVSVVTELTAHDLLYVLLKVEETFGRVRSITNAPRTLDLDILLYNEQVLDDQGLNIPHPRLQDRAFVLYPLNDLDPSWHHPVTCVSVCDMIRNLPVDQSFEAIEDAEGQFGTEWREK